MLRHGIFVAFPVATSGSDFLSLVQDVLAPHTSAPIDTSGRASCFVLAAGLSFDAEDFQTVSVSVFYIRASFQ